METSEIMQTIQYELLDDTALIRFNQAELGGSLEDRFRTVLSVITLREIPNVIFDVEKVQHMDSLFLATLVSTYKSCCSLGGQMAFVHVTESFRHLLEIVRLDRLIEVYATTEDAVAALRARRNSENGA